MAGFRSLLTFWIGGAGIGPIATEYTGFRSLLAFWIGGAGIVPIATDYTAEIDIAEQDVQHSYRNSAVTTPRKYTAVR